MLLDHIAFSLFPIFCKEMNFSQDIMVFVIHTPICKQNTSLKVTRVLIIPAKSSDFKKFQQKYFETRPLRKLS